MGVSLYYSAYREGGIGEEELRRVREIADEETERLLAEIGRCLPAWKESGAVPPETEEPGELCEGLSIVTPDDPGDPRELFRGSSKVSHAECEMEVMMMQLDHYLKVSLGRLRQAVPGAEWRVHLDDADLVWQEDEGEYTFG